MLEVMNFTLEERAVYEDHVDYLRMEASEKEKTKIVE